jgi:two-component system, NarL family, response regulator DegU
MIKLFVADDHPLFLKGLIDTLKDESDFSLLGSAHDGKTALDQIQLLLPDIAVLDMDMPQMNGVEVAKVLLRQNPSIKVMILSMHKEPDIVKASMALGIHGYIFKDDTVSDLVNGIKVIINGGHFTSSITENKSTRIYFDDVENLLTSLTKMERTILDNIATQLSSKDIADKLYISPKTVENHRSNISRKLKLKGNNSLLKFALNSKEQYC